MESQKYPRTEIREKKELIGILDPLVEEWFFVNLKIFQIVSCMEL